MSHSEISPLSLAFLLFFTLCLAGCGGGGGGSAASDGQPTGNVAILVTDAPTDLYDQILLTITAIELLPEEDSEAGAINLFSGEETIDLLQLRDHAELFTLTEEIPVASYAKLRLQVSRILLVDIDTDPQTEVEARLPGGRLDLVPQGALEVNEDHTLYVEIDIDAANSLLVVEEGTGELLFRPVAFLASYEEGEDETGTEGEANDDGTDPEAGPLSAVHGLLRELDAQGRSLLCPSAQASARACVPLVMGESTPVYDADGSLTDLEQVEAGTRMIAMGLLVRDARDGRRALEVLSAMLGTRPTLGTRGGELEVAIDAAGLFTLENGREVALLERAPVVDKRGRLLEAGSLLPGQGLTLMGLVRAEPILAALVVARGDQDTDEIDAADEEGEVEWSQLRGELLSVDTDNTLQVEVDGQARWVRLASDGSLVISGAGKVEGGDLAGLADLGRVRITAKGQPGDAYFEAQQIIAIVLKRNDRLLDD